MEVLCCLHTTCLLVVTRATVLLTLPCWHIILGCCAAPVTSVQVDSYVYTVDLALGSNAQVSQLGGAHLQTRYHPCTRGPHSLASTVAYVVPDQAM
jgi:hypothetical protein